MRNVTIRRCGTCMEPDDGTGEASVLATLIRQSRFDIKAKEGDAGTQGQEMKVRGRGCTRNLDGRETEKVARAGPDDHSIILVPLDDGHPYRIPESIYHHLRVFLLHTGPDFSSYYFDLLEYPRFCCLCITAYCCIFPISALLLRFPRN